MKVIRKNIHQLSGILTLLLLVLISACGSSDPAEVEKEEHSDSKNKEVELNQAQYDASNIQLGDFELKNLSAVINANGYTKLPPQNQADVSVLVAGLIKKINIIEGQFVKQGQTLAVIESMEFTKIQEAYLTSKSNLELMLLEYERQKTLNEGNANSKKHCKKQNQNMRSRKRVTIL